MTYTQKARNAIRESGLPFWTLWTNKYKKCRTVKAMVKGNVTPKQIARAKAFIETQIPEANVKFREHKDYFGSTEKAFIVRVPIDY